MSSKENVKRAGQLDLAITEWQPPMRQFMTTSGRTTVIDWLEKERIRIQAQYETPDAVRIVEKMMRGRKVVCLQRTSGDLIPKAKPVVARKEVPPPATVKYTSIAPDPTNAGWEWIGPGCRKRMDLH